VIGDREDPSGEFGARLKSSQAPERFEERLLGAVARFFGIAHRANTKVVHRPLVAFHKRPERIAAARERGGDERPVVAFQSARRVHRGRSFQERGCHWATYGPTAREVSRNTESPTAYLIRRLDWLGGVVGRSTLADLAADSEVLVPLAAIFCLFGLPVLAFIFFRVMAHRERMEMIRNGFAPGVPPKGWRTTGAAQSAGHNPMPVADLSTEAAHVTLRKGITLTFIGFAITLGLSFIGFRDGANGMTWHLGPWLLGGFIPMFVGLAQVIIALLSGATLQVPRQSAGGAPPPYYGEPPGPGAQPSYDAPYAYRPGTTQELRPPKPPERRP